MSPKLIKKHQKVDKASKKKVNADSNTTYKLQRIEGIDLICHNDKIFIHTRRATTESSGMVSWVPRTPRADAIGSNNLTSIHLAETLQTCAWALPHVQKLPAE
jgi:hypothetical protein